MCGIVGLFLKNPDLRPKLGSLFKPMLSEMQSRGPDSAGVALYRYPAAEGFTKFSLAHNDIGFDWQAMATHIVSTLHCKTSIEQNNTHALLTTNSEENELRAYLNEHANDVRLVGSGQLLEIFKEVGRPDAVYDRFELDNAGGSHMIGHTRMATESAVTTAGSHPFATGDDLCLVHNGSLSNHNRLRVTLEKAGLEFQTDNDSEVAAAYMTWKLRQGASLHEALTDALEDLDGFYTFCIGTANGFAVLRDPIACKHAVLAETEDWVAMATEYRAIAALPHADKARIWEPKPATIYSWGDTTEQLH